MDENHSGFFEVVQTHHGFEKHLLQLEVKTENGELLFDVEMVARSLGLVSKAKKKGVEYESVRWSRVNDFLPQVAELKKGDFISEPMIYKIGHLKRFVF